MIYTTLKVRYNTPLTEAYWKEQARGVIDEYGNAFRIVTLRWRNSSLHRCTDYQKTTGFEDAIIGRGKNSEIGITYRRNGSVMWMRPPGGVGRFTGELAVTPRNMARLASHVRNNLWDIVDDDIRLVVEEMYRKREAIMDPATKKFNETWYRRMHTMSMDKDDPVAAEQSQIVSDKEQIKEENRRIEVEKQEQAAKAARLKIKEDEINRKAAGLVGDGVVPIAYKKEFLEDSKTGYLKLKSICKELGIEVEKGDRKPELVKKITGKQEGNRMAVDKEPAPSTLED